MPEEAKRPSVLMTDEQKLIELDNVISTHSDNVDVASVNKLVDKYGAYAYDIVYKALDPVNLVEHTDGQYRNTRYTISYFANNDISSDKLAAIVGYDDAQKIEGKLVQYEAALLFHMQQREAPQKRLVHQVRYQELQTGYLQERLLSWSVPDKSVKPHC